MASVFQVVAVSLVGTRRHDDRRQQIDAGG